MIDRSDSSIASIHSIQIFIISREISSSKFPRTSIYVVYWDSTIVKIIIIQNSMELLLNDCSIS